MDQIAIRFGTFVAGVDQGDLQVRGVNNATYPVSGFRWDEASRIGVWTLARPVLNDKLLIVLDDAGLPGLDGEWSTGQQFPSGQGGPGGDFAFRINVLRGDVTRDTSVNALDLGQLKARLNKNATTNQGSGNTAYNIFADVNADGFINALDLGIAKSMLTKGLPTAEPTATSLLFAAPPARA